MINPNQWLKKIIFIATMVVTCIPAQVFAMDYLLTMGNNNQECCICNEDTNTTEETITLQCQLHTLHTYHKNCIDQWIYTQLITSQTHPNCPLCRTPINKKYLEKCIQQTIIKEFYCKKIELINEIIQYAKENSHHLAMLTLETKTKDLAKQIKQKIFSWNNHHIGTDDFSHRANPTYFTDDEINKIIQDFINIENLKQNLEEIQQNKLDENERTSYIFEQLEKKEEDDSTLQNRFSIKLWGDKKINLLKTLVCFQ